MSEKISQNFGSLPELLWVALDNIEIDNNYQRNLNEAHARRIARNFNWKLFQPPSLSRVNGFDDRFKAFDGQHRIEGARMTGEIEKIPGYVIEAPTISEQAKAFITLNKSRIQVTPVDIYWASIAAKDPIYLQLEKILDKVGVAIVEYVGHKKANRITSVTTLLRTLKRDGEGSLEKSLKTLKEAKPGDSEAFPGNFIDAVSKIFNENQDNVDTDYLIDMLDDSDFRMISVDAYRRKELLGGSTPMAIYSVLVEKYNEQAEKNGVEKLLTFS